MLFSNSPVKNIVEKLNPFSQKNKISRLKFERKGDYGTFLKFIKNSTKEIEDIKIPDSEDKKRKGLMIGGGILGLGLLGFAGRGKRDSDDGTGKLQSISGVIQKAKADSKKATSGGKGKSDLDRFDDVLDKRRFETSKRFRKIRKKYQQPERLKDYLKEREKRRKIIKKNAPKKVKIPNKFSVDLTKKREFAGVTGDTLDTNEVKKRSRRKSLVTSAGSDGDTPIGSPSKKDIADQKEFRKKYEKRITKPKPGEITKQQRIVRNFNKSQITEPTRISDQNFKNLSGLFSGDFGSDDLDNIIKEQRGFDKEGRRIVPRQVDKTDTLQSEIDMRKLKQAQQQEIFNRQYGTDGGYGDSNVGDMTQNKSSKRITRATIDRSKFFEAPEVPKKITPKQLTQFDKFNKLSNRILNSPAAKFTTFLGGMFSNPKLMILKTLMDPTPLADGTLEGKPGVGVNPEKLMLDEDTAVNIFMPPEGNQSMIPFNADVQLPSVSTPTEIQTGSNKIVVDYEFNTTEDLFFIKMAGS